MKLFTSFFIFPLAALLLVNAATVNAQQDVEVTANVADTAKPSITITHPKNGSNWYGFLNITTRVSDNVGVAKVEFYIDGFLKITDTGEPFIYIWDTATAQLGKHTIKAVAYDAAGNSASDSVVVNITAFPAKETKVTTKAGGERKFLIFPGLESIRLVEAPIDFIRANTNFFFGFLFALELLILYWIIKKLREKRKKENKGSDLPQNQSTTPPINLPKP